MPHCNPLRVATVLPGFTNILVEVTNGLILAVVEPVVEIEILKFGRMQKQEESN